MFIGSCGQRRRHVSLWPRLLWTAVATVGLAAGSWLIVLAAGSGSAMGVPVASSVSAVVVALGAVWAGQARPRKDLAIAGPDGSGSGYVAVTGRESGSAGGERLVVVGDIPREPQAFQDRPGLLDALISDISGRPAVVVAVTGLRGVGKSQLAAACARCRLEQRWRVVAWIDAEDRA